MKAARRKSAKKTASRKKAAKKKTTPAKAARARTTKEKPSAIGEIDETVARWTDWAGAQLVGGGGRSTAWSGARRK
jgi:hypothetical protein